jgi:ABC-type glycerol-3-phosphate transport system substrate-binding protein
MPDASPSHARTGAADVRRLAGDPRRIAGTEEERMSRPQGTPVTRRRFWRRSAGLAASAGSLAALVACVPQQPAPQSTNGQPTALNLVWSGWILDQNPVINTLIDQYAKETNVQITASSAPDDLQQKILLETNQQKSTWGGWEGHTAFLNSAPMATAGSLSPFDPYLTGGDRKDLLASSVTEVTFNGKMYEFPFRVSPMAMIYRPSILQKLKYEGPPDTWDGVFELCARAQRDLSTSAAPFYGIGLWSTAWYGLWEVMETLVPEPFDTKTGLAKTNIPEAAQAMEIMKKLYAFAPVDTLSTDPLNYFQSGNMAMMMIYVLQAQRVKQAVNGDVRIGRVPKTGKAQGTIFWSSGADLFTHYGNLPEVAKFWLWLSNQKALYDTLWVKNGSPPNRISMLERFKDLKGSELDPGFWDAADMQARAQPIPNSLGIPTQAKYTKSETENYLLGTTRTAEEAIQSIKKQTADEIAKQEK